MDRRNGDGGSSVGLPYIANTYFIGSEVPTEKLAQPHIIEDPLHKLYPASSFRLYRRLSSDCQEVQIRIYNSGVVFVGRVAKKKTEWFPIQQLYCAACLRPDIEDGELVFKQYGERLSKKAQKRQAIFAVALRELECGEKERKVIRCFAFLVSIPNVAKELVTACRNAFSNKSGWNHPISDLEIVIDRSRIALDCLDLDDYELLQEDSRKREEALRKKPVPVLASSGNPRRSSSFTKSHSAPPTPRQQPRNSLIASRPISVRPISQRAALHPPNGMVLQPSLMLRPGQLKVVKSASVTGFPLSRSSSKSTSASFGHPSPRSIDMMNGDSPYNAHPKMRRPISASSKGHKVIASSEPQDLINGNGPPTSNENPYQMRRKSSGENRKEAVILDWSKLPNSMMTGGLNGERITNGKSNGIERQRSVVSSIDEFNSNPSDLTPIKVRGKRVSKKRQGYSVITSDNLNITANGYVEGHSVADMPM